MALLVVQIFFFLSGFVCVCVYDGCLFREIFFGLSSFLPLLLGDRALVFFFVLLTICCDFG